jgi:TetR/AcrR family transcriptional regulator, regulator of cefoperazone and chloramphenicol sensitivity
MFTLAGRIEMKIERQDAVRTRKDLLMAASDIFAKKGFRDATIAEISQRAGANIAAVNYHFGDKETLYREAWRQSFRDSIKAHPPDGGVDLNASPEQRLKGQVFALLRRITDNDNKDFLIVNKELANPTGLLEEVMQEEMRPLRRRIMAPVREILGQRKSEIEVRFCTLSIVSQCVIPAFTNMVEKPETDGENESLRIDDVEAYAEHVVAFSLAGMGAIRGSARESSALRRPHPHAPGSPENNTRKTRRAR